MRNAWREAWLLMHFLSQNPENQTYALRYEYADVLDAAIFSLIETISVK